jgi:methanogenic corrinoid protein MtbC1
MMCASRGFKTHYLGPDLPPAEIARFACEVRATVVALSVVLHERLAEAPAQLGELAAQLPDDVAIWLGGAAARELPRDSLPSRCVVLADGAELEQRLEMLPA